MINNDTLHDNGMYIHWFIGDIISDGEKLRFRGVKDISDNLYIYIYHKFWTCCHDEAIWFQTHKIMLGWDSSNLNFRDSNLSV